MYMCIYVYMHILVQNIDRTIFSINVTHFSLTVVCLPHGTIAARLCHQGLRGCAPQLQSGVQGRPPPPPRWISPDGSPFPASEASSLS